MTKTYCGDLRRRRIHAKTAQNNINVNVNIYICLLVVEVVVVVVVVVVNKSWLVKFSSTVHPLRHTGPLGERDRAALARIGPLHRQITSEGGMIRSKPSSCSNVSIRAFPVHPLIELRQAVPKQLTRKGPLRRQQKSAGVYIYIYIYIYICIYTHIYIIILCYVTL